MPKLHLSSGYGEDLEILKRVFESHDWLCDCENFPECEDFQRFLKLKKRIETLEKRSRLGWYTGHRAHLNMKQKIRSESFLEGFREGTKFGRENP